MAYLEELLPEFRKGAKIRRKIWSDKVFMSSENIGESCLCARDIDANDWELWQEPKEDIDWDYIIKNKCLCWFWDHSEERKRTGLLARLISQDEYRFEKGGYNGEPSIPYMNCRPVRKDELNLYEERNDE